MTKLMAAKTMLTLFVSVILFCSVISGILAFEYYSIGSYGVAMLGVFVSCFSLCHFITQIYDLARLLEGL